MLRDRAKDHFVSASVATRSGNQAIVVGGGFGGIAAALRLRAKGYAVRLIDRCARLGGRAQVFERDGFRYDAGPTVLTAPQLFEELFALFDKRLADYVTLVAPDPWYAFRFADGETLKYGPTEGATEAEIARLSPTDVDGYRRLGDASRAIYDVAFTGLAHKPFHNPLFMLRQVPALLRLRSYDSVWDMVSRHLKDDRLRRAFSIQPLLLGGNPFDTTSIYAMINHLERAYGVWFAMGGTGALVDALHRLMQEVGIAVETGTTIERVSVVNGRVTGVIRADGSVSAADVVIANTDPVRLYRDLLPPGTAGLTARLRNRTARLSMGLYVLYFGARRQWPDVAHHTVWFGSRHRELLSDIFHRGVLAEDFSLYLHRPTATDPTFAPPGCDSFYVLCPVPNQRAGIDWSVEGPRLRDRIVAALDATILPGLRDTICAEFAKTPDDFETDYLSEAGAGFSLSPFFTQSAWFRYHNRGEGVRGLYLVGAGTHPGGGVPGVISSAKVIGSLVPDLAPTS
ncbi:phytoene desaturase family protein [Salinisphaera sp. LB1]|uniref:phytoene desaturase family protein n=1 Tax=Salinisphaera sp. LB1 TaxID=2183911 RepID=UPI000D7081FE|nr:phytoene desaturase family protein [Salinisphaera sp. LB1]AWN15475.1 Phytoene dehydrogenase [Salinisphaera sp. LB1]